MRITVRDSDALLLVQVLESGLRLNPAFGEEAFEAVKNFSARIHSEVSKFARELEMQRLLAEREASSAEEPTRQTQEEIYATLQRLHDERKPL